MSRYINFTVIYTSPDGKFYARYRQLTACQNLAGLDDMLAQDFPINGITSVKPYIISFQPSLKAARETAEAWNERYRENGTLWEFYKVA